MIRRLAGIPLIITLLTTPLLASAATYSIVDLGTLGAPGTQAHAIGAGGRVVGEATAASGENHAFLYSAGAMTDLEIGGSSSTARSINSSGQVAGYYYERGYKAFVWTNGRSKDLGSLGGNYAAAYAINSDGHACGSAFNRANQEHAFLWTGRRMTDLGTLGGLYSTARGIAAGDQVVGYAYRTNGAFHAFLWSGNAMRDLGTLGGDYSAAYAINDAGQIVGQGYGPSNRFAHAVLWSGGAMRDLGDLGAGISQALAIDSHATVIVGNAQVPSNGLYVVYHAFVWSGGVMRDLNTLIPAGTGWMLEEADGVDDSGQIIGWGELAGTVHGFLLTPTGENPATANAATSARTEETPAVLSLRHVGPNPARLGAELRFTLPRRAGWRST